MAYLTVVILLMLVAHTSQKKPADKTSILNVDPCGKDKHRIDELSAMIGDVWISRAGCDVDSNFAPFTDNRKPKLLYRKAKTDELYLVLVYDADSSGCKSTLKFMMGDLEGKDLSKGFTSNGVVFANYNRPDESQADKETHRYFIYVFEQSYPLAGMAFTTEDRCKFDVDKFIDGQGLKLKAGTMFKITK